MLKGDRILAINDSIDVPCWGAFHEHIRQFPDKTVSLTVLRNADTLQLSATPDSTGTVGLLATPPPYKTQSYTLGETMKYGWKDAMTMLYLNIKGLGKVFSGEDKAKDSVAGPIGIAQIYGGVWDWGRFWYITGLLSLILAFMNVIPIPGLDGGPCGTDYRKKDTGPLSAICTNHRDAAAADSDDPYYRERHLQTVLKWLTS